MECRRYSENSKNNLMNVLGIETSCDETAAAVVTNGTTILSNIVATSLKEHEQFGGIIPEIASRKQLEYIHTVVEKALLKSKLSLKQINAIAVTSTPGLIGSLLVGTSFARSLATALNKPLIHVDHIKAHIYANFLSHKNDPKSKAKLPAIALVVSGGHTNLYLIKNFQHFQLLGKTIDDAAGEAFDKVAKILNLGYPGGPAIDKISKQVKSSNITFTCAPMKNTFNFSFSGIKTAVLYHHQKNNHAKSYKKSQVAYAFEKSVVQLLVNKCLEACQKHNTKTLLVGGGVSANSRLRNFLTKETAQKNIKVFFPSMKLCIDNAAMIAGLGFHNYKHKSH